MGKKTVCLIILSIWCSFCFANSFAFQIVQNNKSLNDVCETSLVIEDSLLSYFFDAGYIVTNYPVVLSSNEKQNDSLFSKGYDEAAAGSMSEFVQICLYFKEMSSKDIKNVALGRLDKISWKIKSVKSGAVIEEKSKEVLKPIGTDTESNVRIFAYEFAEYLQKVLK